MTRLELQIGDRVRAIRDAKGWFQMDLAKAAHLPVRTIGRIERGEVDPRIGTLAAISAALGVCLKDLLP